MNSLYIDNLLYGGGGNECNLVRRADSFEMSVNTTREIKFYAYCNLLTLVASMLNNTKQQFLKINSSAIDIK